MNDPHNDPLTQQQQQRCYRTLLINWTYSLSFALDACLFSLLNVNQIRSPDERDNRYFYKLLNIDFYKTYFMSCRRHWLILLPSRAQKSEYIYIYFFYVCKLNQKHDSLQIGLNSHCCYQKIYCLIWFHPLVKVLDYKYVRLMRRKPNLFRIFETPLLGAAPAHEIIHWPLMTF